MNYIISLATLEACENPNIEMGSWDQIFAPLIEPVFLTLTWRRASQLDLHNVETFQRGCKLYIPGPC